MEGRFLRLAGILAGALSAAMVLSTGTAPAGATGAFEIDAPDIVVFAETLQTAPIGLGELLADPVTVTDDELASVGSEVIEPLQLSGGADDFVVDDDAVQCPEADFTTATGIQQAILAALPGDKIRVCPGTYTPITVNKPLTLYAPVQHGQATRCMEAIAPDPTKDAIIDAGNTNLIAVNLQANSIVFYGFTVQNVSNNPGILSSSLFSGYEILFNTVQRNTIGLYFNASGTLESRVHHNCFRDNDRPGAAGETGIYSDQGLVNAFVEHNTLVRNPNASMIFTLNQQDLTIAHNFADNTIVLVSTRDTIVEFNHLQMAAPSSGLFFGGAVVDTVARMNLIENASTGISSNVAFVPTPNQLELVKNHVRGSTFDGIRLTNTDNSVVSGNRSERNGRHGIRLLNDSDNNTVDDNHSHDNVRDGLRVDADGSSENTIQQNKMLQNGEHDCHDDTVGGGTSLTANVWLMNNGRTENRPGLCKNATVTP